MQISAELDATLQDPGQQMKTLCKKGFKINGKTPSPVLRISFELLRGKVNMTTSATVTAQLLRDYLFTTFSPSRFSYCPNSCGIFLEYIFQL